jgi:hypothetical protein
LHKAWKSAKIRDPETKEIISMNLINKNVLFYRNISFSMDWVLSSGRECNFFSNPSQANLYLNNPSLVNIFTWLPQFTVSEKLQ